MCQTRRGPMPRVTYSGSHYCLKSRKTVVPDFATMERFDCLQWLIENTTPRGYSRAPNPLTGMGGAVSMGIQ